jgi:cytidylate kinase
MTGGGGTGRRARVAIDGPAGAGKSTVARRLAERLGYVLVDTGALYRTVALAAQQAGIAWSDADAVGALARRLVATRGISLSRGDLDPSVGGSGVRVTLDGEDVSLAIRAPEMSLGASRVSAIPAVRQALLEVQRQAGATGGVVLEGRDIGTVVFPEAEVKFFLTASPEVRARRRWEELAARGTSVSLDATLAEVVARDRADTERPVAPLRKADDAIEIDSSKSSPDDVIEAMARIVEERMASSG